jgi:hypothetical protein
MEKDFLMNIPPPSIQKSKIGLCPHGLPAGACPICSGMGGGGGGSTKRAQNAGEMSWDECYAVWQQMLKAKDLQQQRKAQTMQAQMQGVNISAKIANAAQKIANLSQKLVDFVQKTQNQTLSLPKIIAKPLALAAQIAIPILNAIKNVVVIAQKALNFIQAKFADISDKLSAIFGELKNSVEKKISDRLKDFKKKFKSLFGILDVEETETQEREADVITQRSKED